jgi:hypothetical protein
VTKVVGEQGDEGNIRILVTGDWRKLHNEELHNSYFSSDVITTMEVGA